MFELEVQKRDDQGNLIIEKAKIEPSKTVAFVIDMWDYHPDKTFLNRVHYMIPRFNKTLEAIIYLGIASNMCLSQYRMFGLHHARRRGYRVFFVSDAVEAISGNGYDADLEAFDPDLFPAKGTALTQRHLEKYGGPSFLSRQLLDLANTSHLGDDRRKQIVFVMAEDSCDTQKTLPEFAKKHLEEEFRCTYCFAESKHRNSIKNLDALYDADLLVLSMERRFLQAWQMDRLARFIFNANKPLIALRPSVVAFAEGDGKRSRGLGRIVWNGFNREVLGCNFLGTCQTHSESGFIVRPVPQYLSHPIMSGLENVIFRTKNPLYRINPLSLSATPLLMAERHDVQSDQIIAWTNFSYDSKIFYTSLCIALCQRCAMLH